MKHFFAFLFFALLSSSAIAAPGEDSPLTKCDHLKAAPQIMNVNKFAEYYGSKKALITKHLPRAQKGTPICKLLDVTINIEFSRKTQELVKFYSDLTPHIESLGEKECADEMKRASDIADQTLQRFKDNYANLCVL